MEHTIRETALDDISIKTVQILLNGVGCLDSFFIFSFKKVSKDTIMI